MILHISVIFRDMHVFFSSIFKLIRIFKGNGYLRINGEIEISNYYFNIDNFYKMNFYDYFIRAYLSSHVFFEKVMYFCSAMEIPNNDIKRFITFLNVWRLKIIYITN